MKAILGKKLGMSQVFTPAGEVVPVTLILALPNTITIRRDKARAGYEAVQLALPRKSTDVKTQNTEQSAQNTEKEAKDGQKRTPTQLKKRYSLRREFTLEVDGETAVLTVEQFAVGDVVQVSGLAKGKGFQGVVKRHGFKGGPASHGHSDWERRPGSIGQRFPQHTLKGKRMAGRMGGQRVTVKNLEVMHVDTDKNLLAIKGAVPGRRGAVLEVRSIEV